MSSCPCSYGSSASLVDITLSFTVRPEVAKFRYRRLAGLTCRGRFEPSSLSESACCLLLLNSLPLAVPSWKEPAAIQHLGSWGVTSTEILVSFPELGPRQTRAFAHEYVRVKLAFLVLDSVVIAIVPCEPARGERPLSSFARKADHNEGQGGATEDTREARPNWSN